MKKTILIGAILSLGMMSCQNDEFNSMIEESTLNQEIKKIEYLMEEGAIKEESIYQEGDTKIETSMSFEDRLVYYDFLKRNAGQVRNEYTGPTRSTTYNEETFGLVLKSSSNQNCGIYRELILVMDCEDNNSQSYTSGNTGQTFVDSNGNVNFFFCIIPASNITNGLHKIDKGFARYFDCEDHNTNNAFYVNGLRINNSYVNGTKWGITENSSGNITFYFINNGIGSIGFGHKTGSNNGIIYTDDEDDDNTNQWIVPVPMSLDAMRSFYLGEYEKNSEIKVHFDI